jgi:hypothetical protein
VSACYRPEEPVAFSYLYKPLSKQQHNGRLDVGSFQEDAIESALFSQAADGIPL